MSSSVERFLEAAVERAKPPMDHWNRYLLPGRDGKKAKGRTRVTTIAQSISDKFQLNAWQIRMTAIGLAHHPDLLAGVASLATVDVDNKALDKICAEARERAGANVGANLGNALHRFTDLVDSGRDVIIPAPWDADIAAYVKAMSDAGIVIHPEWIERVVLLEELNVAGTFDRIVELPGVGLVVADLKTGKDVSYKHDEFAVQMALYAHGDALWRAATNDYEPMPDVSHDVGIVMHAPVGTGTCTLYEIDIAEGWKTVELCMAARAWRSRKDLARPLSARANAPEGQVSEVGSQDLRGLDSEWIMRRFAGLADHEQARRLAALGWPKGVPVDPPWSPEQVEALADMLDDIEGEVGAPFGAEQPSEAAKPHKRLRQPDVTLIERCPDVVIDDRSEAVSRDEVDAMRAVLAMLTPPQLARIRQWSTEARREGRTIDIVDGRLTERGWSILRAAYVCATRLCPQPSDGATGIDETRVRAALAVVLDREFAQSWWVGAVLGSLTQDEAVALCGIADAYAAGDRDAIDAVDNAVVDLDAPF